MTAAPPDDGLFERLLADALAECRGPGQGCETYERRGALLEFVEDEEGTRTTSAEERGFALRLFRGGRVAFAAGGPEAAPRLLARARPLVPRARAQRGARPPAPLPGEEPAGRPLATPAPGEDGAARNAMTLFRRTVTAAGAGAVALRDLAVAAGERRERLATSAGRDVAWTTRAATLVATLVGRTPRGRFSARVVAAAPRPEDLPAARLARHAVDRVLLPLTGRPFSASRPDVLLDSHVAAHLVGRLGPLFVGEASAILASRTRSGREAFASPFLTLVDDAAAPGGIVRVERDGEGNPASRTTVVVEGRPAARLLDVAAAARSDARPTGNSVRTAWSEAPIPGLTNFFVDPSAGVSPLDLLAGVARGLYAAALIERPEVDLAADRFRLVVCGWAIEKGRAAGRVSEAVVAGRLSELLRSVSAIGDDLKFAPGGTGGVGSPTLLVPRWRGTT